MPTVFHSDDSKPLNYYFICQDLVEKVMLLRKAVELVRGQPPEVDSGLLADKLTQYAQLLAAQGSLHTAINYLTESTQVREQTHHFSINSS